MAIQTKANPFEKVKDTVLFNGEKIHEYRMQNGFRVIVVPRHQAKVLTYQVWFHVGSVDEKLDPKLKKTGLAHLFEHMMFRGTKKYPDGEFDTQTARIGGDKQNATTWYYRTNYYESVPSLQLEKIMELESDRMQNLNLTLDLFEKEKGAVVGEYRRHEDTPTSIAHDELTRLVYKKAPYQWTVLGTEEEIKGFKLEEAQYFYKTFYAPNNGTLIVIGDVKPEKLLPLVDKYYGPMKPQVIPKAPIPEEPTQTAERKYDRTHKQATSEFLLMGYRIPGVNSEDMVALSLLQSHLSTGMEARLRKILVDTGIAVQAQAGPASQPDLFQFSVLLADGQKAEKAIRAIDKEIKLLQTKKLAKAELNRARNQELLTTYRQMSDNSHMADMLGEYLMLSGNYLRGFEVLEGYKSTTAADLQRVAKEHLKASQRSIVIIRPEKKG